MTTSSGQLLIIGASVRAAAQSARRAEQSVWGADLFADEDLKAIATAKQVERYPTGFLPALRNAPQAPWLYTGALENFPRLVQRLENVRPLLGNGYEVLKAVRDPLQLGSKLSAAGIAYPETHLLPTASAVADLSVGTKPDSWLVKPRRSAAGNHVRFLSQENLDLRRFKTGTNSVLCQKFIPGQSASAVFVGAGGKAVLLGVTRQWVGRQDLGAEGFSYCGSSGPVSISAAEQKDLQHIGGTLADRFSLTGLFGVDLIQTAKPDGAPADYVVIEVNPRYTASVEVLERAFGFSAIRWHLQACTAGSLPSAEQIRAFTPNGWHAKGILFAKKPAKFHEPIASYVRQLNAESQHPQIADITAVGSSLMPGRPVVTLFAQAGTETDAQLALLKAVRKFETFLYQPPG